MTSTGHLTNRQEKHVYDLIEDAGFDPTEFCWDRPPDPSKMAHPQRYIHSGAPEQELRHEPSGSYFRFKYIEDQHPGRAAPSKRRDHHVEFRPTEAGDVEQTYGPLHWAAVLQFLERWLRVLRAERETPDVWAQVRNARERIEGLGSGGEAEEPFTPEEQAGLREGLDEFQEWVREEFELRDEQIETLQEHVSDLRDQLGSLKRRTWTNLALGVILRVGSYVGFDGSHFKEAFRFLEELVGNLPQLPPGS